MNYLFNEFENKTEYLNIQNPNLNNISPTEMLNCKKQTLVSFRDYLKIVIKSIDNEEHNELMINELCFIINSYYKNIEDNSDNLSVFYKKYNVCKYNEYEADSQTVSSDKNTNSDDNEILLVNKPENKLVQHSGNKKKNKDDSDEQSEDETKNKDETDEQSEDETKNKDKTDEQSEDETDEQTEDETDEQTEDETDEQTEDETDEQSEDETDEQTEDKTDEQSEDETDEQSEDKIDEQSEDETDEQTEDETDEQTEDETDEQTEDETNKQHDSNQKSNKNNKKSNNNIFFESFINNDFDINKKVFKVNPDSILYLKNFIKESFIY